MLAIANFELAKKIQAVRLMDVAQQVLRDHFV